MDPLTTWEELQHRLIQGEDRSGIEERAAALAEWLEKGEYIPVAMVTRYGQVWRAISCLTDVALAARASD